RACDPRLQRRTRRHHALGLAKDDPGLIARRCRRIDMRTRFTIGDQGIKRRAGQKHRLAVLPCYFDIGGAKPAQTVLALPAIKRADDELLPGLQHEGFARPFAGRMAQMAEEVDRMTSRASIPDKATLLAVLEVRQMPFAGKAHQPASDNPATDHRA